MPTCIECGWKSFTLATHIRYDHQRTITQYKQLHGVTNDAIFHPELTKQRSNRISGENNPGYQHNGTLSSFSKKYTKYKGMDDDTKEQKIKDQHSKLINTRSINNNDTTTLAYYTSRGMPIEEAEVARSERQRTFSLDICVEKYGLEQGMERWIQRQESWISSPGIQAMSSGVSKISQEMLDEVARGFDGECMYATNGRPDCNNEYNMRTRAGIVRLDFFVPDTGHIIEFDGDYWHSDKNPKYIPNEIKDAKILTSFPHLKILHIRECDYRTDKQGTINKCLSFLKT